MTPTLAFLDRYPWWQRATARERVAVGIGAGVLVIALVASIVVVPMQAALADAPQQRAQRKALLDVAKQRVTAIGTLRRDAMPRVDARASIEAALDRQHIARGDATIDTANDRIALTLPAVRIGDAAAIIDALAHDGLRVSAATLAARADSPDIRAEIAFVRANP